MDQTVHWRHCWLMQVLERARCLQLAGGWLSAADHHARVAPGSVALALDLHLHLHFRCTQHAHSATECLHLAGRLAEQPDDAGQAACGGDQPLRLLVSSQREQGLQQGCHHIFCQVCALPQHAHQV